MKKIIRIIVSITAVIIVTFAIPGDVGAKENVLINEDEVEGDSQIMAPDDQIDTADDNENKESKDISGNIVEETEKEQVNEDFSFTQESKNEQGIMDSKGNAGEVVLKISAHIQGIGWKNDIGNGEMIGTTGLKKRLEAIRIQVDNSTGFNGSIQYKVHVQGIGWQQWKNANEIAGTVGQSKRIEAVQIRLTGELKNYYQVYYRSHIADFGWLSWVEGEKCSGSEGLAKRQEALIVKVVARDNPAEIPSVSGRGYYCGFRNSDIKYSGHIQRIGTVSSVISGQILGTVGEKRRLEGITIMLDQSAETSLKGDIQYRTHVQGMGWLDWTNQGKYNGTTGKSKRIEAVQIRLTGELSQGYDVYYRTHVQGFGWLGWAKNGQKAGTTNYAYRMEALQVMLIPKNTGAPGRNSNYYKEGKNGWYYENGYKYYYVLGKKLYDVRSIIGRQSSYQLKINKQSSCVTAYAKDGSKGYIIPVVSFACSPGNATPLGTFYTGVKHRWHQLFGAVGQYTTQITGNYLFHSVLYRSFNNHTLSASSYNNLGNRVSHGCVRLRVIDAKWIYDNCGSRTRVTIYNSATPGPFPKPSYKKIPSWQNYDPTDPYI